MDSDTNISTYYQLRIGSSALMVMKRNIFCNDADKAMGCSIAMIIICHLFQMTTAKKCTPYDVVYGCRCYIFEVLPMTDWMKWSNKIMTNHSKLMMMMQNNAIINYYIICTSSQPQDG